MSTVTRIDHRRGSLSCLVNCLRSDCAHERGKREIDIAKTLKLLGALVTLLSPFVGHAFTKEERLWRI